MGVRRRERTPCGRKSAERWPECFVTRNQTQRNEQVSDMLEKSNIQASLICGRLIGGAIGELRLAARGR